MLMTTSESRPSNCQSRREMGAMEVLLQAHTPHHAHTTFTPSCRRTPASSRCTPGEHLLRCWPPRPPLPQQQTWALPPVCVLPVLPVLWPPVQAPRTLTPIEVTGGAVASALQCKRRGGPGCPPHQRSLLEPHCPLPLLAPRRGRREPVGFPSAPTLSMVQAMGSSASGY